MWIGPSRSTTFGARAFGPLIVAACGLSRFASSVPALLRRSSVRPAL
jgi:hypothetical protein